MAEKDAICISRRAFCLHFDSFLFTDLYLVTVLVSAVSGAFISVEGLIKLVEYGSSAESAFATVYSSPALGDGVHHCQRLHAVRYVDRLLFHLGTVVTVTVAAVI